MMPQTIIILGPPGAGKSTQLERLRTAIPEPALFVSFGTLVREFMEGESGAARRAKALLTEGHMLPRFLSIAVWAPYLFKHLTDEQHLVLEGAPRHLFEGEALDSFFTFYGRTRPITVFAIKLDRQEALARLSARNHGRPDDSEEGSIRRLNWYETETLPTLEWLRTQPGYRVVDIDGDGSVEEVAGLIRQSLAAQDDSPSRQVE